MADKYIRKKDAEDVIAKHSGFETAERAKKWAMMHPIDLDDWFGAAATAIIAVESLEPADVVPVIRCRECARLNRNGYCTRFQNNISGVATSWFMPDDNDFCSQGKKKEETDG